jgi:5-methylcytosine-specific restriction endonuclease McrA
VRVAIQRRALVLNQNYEPLNVCSVRRAFVLVYHGKADVLELGDEPLSAPGAAYDTPSVIRLRHYIRRPHPRPRLTRREVFMRDEDRCQYCGRRGGNLTLDHVMPKHRGGEHAWENLVTACRECNHRKGGRTPQEARMRLLRPPVRPSMHPAVLFAPYLEHYREWSPFVTGWAKIEPPPGAATSGPTNGASELESEPPAGENGAAMNGSAPHSGLQNGYGGVLEDAAAS